MRSAVRWSGAGVLIGLLAVAGCSGSSVTYAGEQVHEPEQFLTELENTWTDDLSEQRVNEHDDARCYFATGADSSDVQPAAYCGPVRHYVDPALVAADVGVPGSGLWDTYEFERQRVEDGYAFSDPELDGFGTELAADVELVRPDGAEPPSDADSLTAPSAPAADPGLITGTDRVEIENGRKPADGTIALPMHSLVVTEVGTADTVATDAGTRVPAKGERFVVARLKTEDGFWADAYTADFDTEPLFDEDELVEAQPSYAVAVGDKRIRVPESDIVGGQALVVSVPEEESEVELVATVAGRDQTFSLTDGEFTSDLPVNEKVGVSRQYPSQEGKNGDLTVRHSLLFTDAYLSSFHPTKGWADKGKAWLIVAIDQVETEISVYYDVRTDPPRSAVVTTDSGTYKSSAEPVESAVSVLNEWRYPVFQVDARDRGFRFRYEPTYFFTTDSGATSPKSGTARLEAQEFDIRFE